MESSIAAASFNFAMALSVSPAPSALAEMDMELAIDRASGNLDLVLLIDVGFLNDPAAIRTRIG